MNYIAKKPDANGYIHFTDEENETWKILYQRQMKTIENRACDDFIAGIDKLGFSSERVPQCVEVSQELTKATGWSVFPVEAMITITEFFTLLSQRKFPAASFIRIREELDYLKEPDIFHELFGHCPLLAHQAYADFCQWYGKTALQADEDVRSLLGRLFWYTIEFGLTKTPQGVRVYGGGILSSHQETIYALESDVPERAAFDLKRMLATPYDYDRIQPLYFVLDSLDQLFEIQQQDIIGIAAKIVAGVEPSDDFIIC
jgi:phenylalanine-4-hydroxylase